MESFAMSDNLKVVSVKGTSYVKGSTAITPKGTAGWDVHKSNFLPYVLPGQDYIDQPDNKIVTPEFVIAKGPAFNDQITSNKWWSPALLQHYSYLPKVSGWVIDRDKAERRSQPMTNEPLRIDFVDMTKGTNTFPDELMPVGVRLWNQNEMYTYTGGAPLGPGDNKFSIDNLAQTNAPIVTIGLEGVHPIANAPSDKLSNVVVNRYSVFDVEMAYSGSAGTMSMQAASGVPYVVFKRTSGTAPFRLWAGSPVSRVSGTNKDTYETFATKSNSELGFKLTMRFLPGVEPPPEPTPRGRAAYYVRADRGEWKKKPVTYGDQDWYTWVNDEATTVWLFAVPHNVNLDDNAAIQRSIDTIMASPAKAFDSDLLYPPQFTGQMEINGQVSTLGYDANRGKLTVGYRWKVTDGNNTGLYLALLPHHRKYMRERDRHFFPMNGDRPQYFYRTLKGEMWLYQGREFVRELDVHGLLPFGDSLWTTNPGAEGAAYATMRAWFWQQEPVVGDGFPDSFAWNYFTYSGPESPPYMPGLAGIYENLVIADQLAQGGNAQLMDPVFKTKKARVAEMMRDKLLDVLKQLVHQWFDIYSAQCLQYNDKFQTVCGYPNGYDCVSHLCDHHFHWGYFLRAVAAIGRHDREWLDNHWTVIEMLIKDSANYDPKDKRFPWLRNFSPFYGHCWANGIALNNGQDQESTSEALSFAFGMVELASLREDPTMLAVGLWLYEEQVCAAEQYWFNVDADLDNDPPPDRYYNGNWPKGFVRFQHAGKTWNNTLVAILGQQAVSRQTHFGNLQGSFVIQMVPVGACNLHLERHIEWLDRTYQSYLQIMHSLPARNWEYENLIAMWQAVVSPGPDDNKLPPFERPGVTGACVRSEKAHVLYAGAVNSQVQAWAAFRATRSRPDFSIRSNAVHFAVMGSVFEGKPTRCYIIYNPSSKDLPIVKFWDRVTGELIADYGRVPARSFVTREQDVSTGHWVAGGLAYTPTPYKPPQRLYLRSGGILDSQPGSAQLPDGESPYPTDISNPNLGLMLLAYEKGRPAVFRGRFSGTLSPDFPYTRFSLFTNPALWPGWTRDEMHNVGAGIEVLIEYNLDGKTRSEYYGPTSKFNLNINNTWLNNNNLTEFATTTVPLVRNSKLNPLTPEVKGARFSEASYVTNGFISVSIWGSETSFKKPMLYLSRDCSPATQRASWIKVPYQ